MAKKLDLIGIGAANIDLLLKINHFPQPDEEVSAEEFHMEGGGSAANVAVGLARLGFNVGFIGCIGRDYFGEYLLNEFQKEKVNISSLRILDKKTGVAVSVVDKEGERMLFVYGEANMMLSPQDIREEYLRETRGILITSIQGDQALEALNLAADYAHNIGVTILFDPGCILIEKGLNAIRGILEKSTVVKFNEKEILSLTRSHDIDTAFKRLEKSRIKNIIVTLGDKGCILQLEGTVTSIPSYSRFNVLDRTGAGDAFSVGLLTGMLKGWSLEESAKFGNLIASISVTKMGARATPTLSELNKYPDFKEFQRVI